MDELGKFQRLSPFRSRDLHAAGVFGMNSGFAGELRLWGRNDSPFGNTFHGEVDEEISARKLVDPRNGVRKDRGWQ